MLSVVLDSVVVDSVVLDWVVESVVLVVESVVVG